MSLAAIWAQAHNRAIGKNGGMPWHLPEDLAHLRRLTMGQPVIMGRATWDSLGEKYQPLPGRRNIVLTRSGDPIVGCETVSSFDEAKELVAGELAWVMGGAQVYEAAMPHIDGIVVTDIDIDVPGADAFAPVLPDWVTSGLPEWEVVRSDPHRGWHTAANGMNYRFTALKRRGTEPWNGDPLAHP